MKKVIYKGDIAPIIQEIDLWGNSTSVPTNEKWVYLSFHRFAACPFCNLRTNELIGNYELFQKYNAEIVSIWPSDNEHLLKFAGNEKTPFPIISDQSKCIYEAYGVTESSFSGAIRLLLLPRLIFKALKNKHDGIEVDADAKLMPASFLVDPNGIVQMAYYGKHFGDHPKIQTILNLIK